MPLRILEGIRYLYPNMKRGCRILQNEFRGD